MTKKDYWLIFLSALLFSIAISCTQTTPGYMDADYYFATARQLAAGKGFTEPFLWNYLDNPSGLPHPSHAYWMPLASILGALSMRLTRGFELAHAQAAFILLSSLVPLLTASLTNTLSQSRKLSFVAAFIAIFSGYYAPFLTTTDTFSLYMVLGGSFLLTLKIDNLPLRAMLLGILAALLHLSRADGLLWLLLGIYTLFYAHFKASPKSQLPLSSFLFPLSLLLFSYALLITPWLFRNYATFGTPLAPGGDQMLWLTSYNQIFAYPAGELSLQTWLASGWDAILAARFWALKLNMGTILGVQGGVIFLPFIIAGAIKFLRSEKFADKIMIHTAFLAWLAIFLTMTLVFPFAGARGGYFHSGAALQPLWWALTPIGLEKALLWVVEKRGWQPETPRKVFMAGMMGSAFLMTAVLMWGRALSPVAVAQAQSTGVPRYKLVEALIAAQEDDDGSAAVLVSNPPGYFLAGERTALAVPDAELETVFEIARRYGAKYLILEEGGVPKDLMPVYNDPEGQSNLDFLGEIKGAQIFAIKME